MRKLVGLLVVLACVLSCAPTAPAAPARKAPVASKTVALKEDIRKFDFPTEYPVGALTMLGVEKNGTDNMGPGIGPAKGQLTIKVPPDSTIELTLNPHCLEHPERLKTLHTGGINRLKMSYLAMEDSEHSICDTALMALPEFKDLCALHVDRSDVTDMGLLFFKSMPSVKYLYCSGAAIEGTAFKDSQKFKNLENLNLIFNPFKYENLKYLSALPHLTELVLNQSNLSDTNFAYLAKCAQVKRLHVQDNKRITDKSLPILRGLTGIEVLNIRGTSITLEGTLTLKNLKLKKLYISVRRYKPEEIEQLTKAFPKTYVSFRGDGVGEENKVYFAPLK